MCWWSQRPSLVQGVLALAWDGEEDMPILYRYVRVICGAVSLLSIWHHWLQSNKSNIKQKQMSVKQVYNSNYWKKSEISPRIMSTKSLNWNLLNVFQSLCILVHWNRINNSNTSAVYLKYSMFSNTDVFRIKVCIV